MAMFAIDLQYRRLNGGDTSDGRFLFRRWYDFEFLLIALSRLRRIVNQAARDNRLSGYLIPALRQFDAAIPALRIMRNVSEHIDDYAFGTGRIAEVRKEMIEVSSLGDP